MKPIRFFTTFPDFYAECAFTTGQQDARDGHDKGRESFMRHGRPEPVGMGWYEAGLRAGGAA